MNNFSCSKCNKKFNTKDKLFDHIKKVCIPSVYSNNIYKFEIKSFGKNKYFNDNGGDIYVIQNDFGVKGFYKIGITTDLYKRLAHYRCGNVFEPRLHCYYPSKNIREADKILHLKLKEYNIKREIYKFDDINVLKNILKEIQKEMNSEICEIIPVIKDETIFKCKYCNNYILNKYDYQLHLLEIHNKNFLINKINGKKNNKLKIEKQNITTDSKVDKQDTDTDSKVVKQEYKCKHCNKNYASYQSRCNHVRRYHNVLSIYDNIQQSVNSETHTSMQTSATNKCCKCEKILSNYFSKWRHEKKCIKTDNMLNNTKKIKKIEKENIEMKKEMELLKIQLQMINNKNIKI